MFLVIKKSRLIIAAALVAIIIICIILAVALGKTQTTNAQARKLIPIYSVGCEENNVALTFDAAWGGDKTMQILDLLDTYNMKATFFLVGFWVDKYPDLVLEIYTRGHLIGNHSTNHPHFNNLSKDAMIKEIETTNQKIKAIIKEDVIYFRAPFGEYNDTLIRIMEEKHMKCIQWNVDSLDWKGISGKEITSNVLSKVRKGSIVLCHNNSDNILDALPLVMLGLQNKKLMSVRLDDIIIHKDYYIDNNGTQYKRSN